jgi:hypothetical protein
VQGTFEEKDIDVRSAEINSFVIVAKRMLTFLINFIDIIIENEKKFSSNLKKMNSFNRFLYEYEIQSVESYSPKMNFYLGMVT